jgi:hypothetical protein
MRLLAPHLAPENVDECVVAATHRRKAEIEAWLAGRFPAAAGAAVPPARVIALRPLAGSGAPTPAPAPAACVGLGLDEPADTPGVSNQLAPGQVVSHVVPRFLVQVPIDERTHAKLRRAQALLGHAVPSGDLARLLDRALDALLLALERQKVAATDRPRPGTAHAIAPTPPRPTDPRSRRIPAAIRRAVWARDGGRCTFTSDGGRRCASRRALEFDHVVPFARGGVSTVEGLRLRCRAHNQFEAERAFGEGFMQGKRNGARHARGACGVGSRGSTDPVLGSSPRVARAPHRTRRIDAHAPPS